MKTGGGGAPSPAQTEASAFTPAQRLKHRVLGLVASRHRHPAAVLLARAANVYLRAWYGESNNDPRLNGECLALRRVYEDSTADDPDGGTGGEAGAFCVFDVGAHEGRWTLVALDCAPNSQVHAFELVPQTAALLEARHGEDPRVTVNAFGLLDEEGPVNVRYYPDSTTGSTTVDFPWPLEAVELEGQAVRGDGYLERSGIRRVHYLKLDAEGSEGRILNGFRSAFDERRIDAVQFEYTKLCVRSRFLLSDFYDFLTPRGYTLGRIFPNRVDFKPYDIFQDENLRHGNFLAVRADRSRLISSLR